MCNLTEEVTIHAFNNKRAILAKLPSNPHVPSMLDVCENTDTNRAYLVLERAGDQTLEAFVAKHWSSLTIELVRDITQQLLQAVDFLHTNDVVHRDIKPDNIMLTLEPLCLKLIDFNIAQDLSQNPDLKGTNGVRVWSAPETRSLFNYHRSCDLWSVGCILYFLCTAKPLDY